MTGIPLQLQAVKNRQIFIILNTKYLGILCEPAAALHIKGFSYL